MSDVAGQLWRALERAAEDGDCVIDLVEHECVDLGAGCMVDHWHRLTMLVGGAAARLWLDGLDEDAVAMSGYTLPQLEVGGLEARGDQLLVDIEALTVMEA